MGYVGYVSAERRQARAKTDVRLNANETLLGQQRLQKFSSVVLH